MDIGDKVRLSKKGPTYQVLGFTTDGRVILAEIRFSNPTPFIYTGSIDDLWDEE